MTEPKPVAIFQPIVSVVEREDGRFDIEIDWADSYSHTFDGVEDEVYESEPGTLGQKAADALDQWLQNQPKHFVIAPREES